MGLTHFGFGYEGNCVVPFYDSVMYLCDTKVENDWHTIEFVYENNYVQSAQAYLLQHTP